MPNPANIRIVHSFDRYISGYGPPGVGVRARPLRVGRPVDRLHRDTGIGGEIAFGHRPSLPRPERIDGTERARRRRVTDPSRTPHGPLIAPAVPCGHAPHGPRRPRRSACATAACTGGSTDPPARPPGAPRRRPRPARRTGWGHDVGPDGTDPGRSHPDLPRGDATVRAARSRGSPPRRAPRRHRLRHAVRAHQRIRRPRATPRVRRRVPRRDRDRRRVGLRGRPRLERRALLWPGGPGPGRRRRVHPHRDRPGRAEPGDRPAPRLRSRALERGDHGVPARLRALRPHRRHRPPGRHDRDPRRVRRPVPSRCSPFTAPPTPTSRSAAGTARA